MKRTAVLTFVCTCILFANGGLTPQALAGPLNLFGFGGRALAMGGAYAAAVEDSAAPFYNPAGLSFAEKTMVEAGFVYGTIDFTLNGERQDLDTVSAFQLGGLYKSKAVNFLRRFSFGGIMHVPRGYLYKRIVSQDARDPHFVFYINQPQHLSVFLCGAFQLSPSVSIGGGLSLKGGLDLLVDLDVAEADETFVNYEANAKVDVLPVAGLRFKPTDNFALGCVYRAHNVKRIMVVTDISIAGTINIPTLTVYNYNMFKPDEIVLGVMYRPVAPATLDVDVTWMNYKKHVSPAPEYEWAAPQWMGAIVNIEDQSQTDFNDIFITRVGLEYRLNSSIALRTGYVYHPSPVSAQRGVTNYLDADKHIVSFGVGFSFEAPYNLLENRIHIDCVGQLHILEKETIEKDDPADPLDQADIEGEILLGGIFFKHYF